jgi:tocopherol O-methyltransferase
MIQNAEISTQEIAHHYDELDTFYRELWGNHLHHGLWETGLESKDEAVEKLSYKVLSLMGNIRGMHVMDIGCGYGGTSRLSVKEGAASVTGITLSAKQYHFARENSQGMPIDYYLGDWLQNTIPDQTFDVAFSIECFSHITNKKKYFEEIKRTLRPGKKFVMAAWLASEVPSVFDRRMILGPICKEGRLPSLCNKKEVKEMIQSSGLEFLEHIDLSQKVAKTWSISIQEVLRLLKTKEGINYFLNSEKKERLFAITVLRILAGYKKGCFQYGLFVMKS